jgi:hydroxypyruvate isomerase
VPRFAANLSMLFTEVDFMQRFERAARAGFEAVEFMFPYAYAADDIRSELDKHGLELILHNLPAGDWEKGERGIACLPDRVWEFRGGVETAIRYATRLGVSQINCLVGKTPLSGELTEVHDTLVDNLRYAAKALSGVGIRLLIEPLNTFDVPGFHLTTSQQAFELMDEVGESNLFLQYDLYHAQRMEGELAGTLSRHLSRIGHIQLADNPGRNEPGTGEINYPYLFNLIDKLGYDGWIGCEYRPQTDTESGLHWRDALSRSHAL